MRRRGNLVQQSLFVAHNPTARKNLFNHPFWIKQHLWSSSSLIVFEIASIACLNIISKVFGISKKIESMFMTGSTLFLSSIYVTLPMGSWSRSGAPPSLLPGSGHVKDSLRRLVVVCKTFFEGFERWFFETQGTFGASLREKLGPKLDCEFLKASWAYSSGPWRSFLISGKEFLHFFRFVSDSCLKMIGSNREMMLARVEKNGLALMIADETH